ncbi:MAG: hypothetical protein M3063_05605 [Actinomycetota bacterium]|nr:hypothetical protein [Actinomycetota bacterium]
MLVERPSPTKGAQVIHLLGAEGGAGSYVDWGVIHISVANIVIIALMVIVFVLALTLPFPGHRRSRGGGSR